MPFRARSSIVIGLILLTASLVIWWAQRQKLQHALPTLISVERDNVFKVNIPGDYGVYAEFKRDGMAEEYIKNFDDPNGEGRIPVNVVLALSRNGSVEFEKSVESLVPAAISKEKLSYSIARVHLAEPGEYHCQLEGDSKWLELSRSEPEIQIKLSAARRMQIALYALIGRVTAFVIGGIGLLLLFRSMLCRKRARKLKYIGQE